MNGNFKMRCIDNTGNGLYYTENKIYEVRNGFWLDDNGIERGDESVKTIHDVNAWSSARWMLEQWNR